MYRNYPEKAFISKLGLRETFICAKMSKLRHMIKLKYYKSNAMQLQIRLVDIMDTNCVGISSDSSYGYGAIRGVYPILSLLSHSCISNARYILRKTSPYLATIRYM